MRDICGDFRLGFAEAEPSFPDQLIKDLSRAGGVAQLIELPVAGEMEVPLGKLLVLHS